MSGGQGIAEAAGEAGARSGGTWRDHVLYGVGLVVPCLLIWLASLRFAEPTVEPGSFSGAYLIMLVPASYLAAWQILFARDIRHGLIGAFATTFVIGLIFAISFLGGLTSLGLLAPPIAMLGVVVLAFLLAKIYNETGPDGRSVRLDWVHLWLGFLALVGLLIVRGISPYFPGLSFEALVGVGALHFLPFLPHAIETWVTLNRSSHRPTIPIRRVASLVAVALVFPALVLLTVEPPWAALTWPARTAADLRERHAEKQWQMLLMRNSRRVQGGGSLVLQLAGTKLTARIPQDWLGPFVWELGPNLRELTLVPDARVNPARARLVSNVRVYSRPDVVTLLPIDASPANRGPGHWREIACAPDAQAWSGATVCRSSVFPELRPPPSRLLARLPNAQLPIRAIYNSPADSSAYYLFGRAFRAVCTMGSDCEFVFPLANGVSVTVTTDEANAPHWSEIRDMVDAAVSAAIGVALSDQPMVLQPEGDLLRIVGPP